MPGPDSSPVMRVVATPAALDAVRWPAGARVLRVAPDEALVLGGGSIEIDDHWAIGELDGGYAVFEMTRSRLEEWMSRAAEWALPRDDSFFTQGSAAGIPVKIWVEGDGALLLTRRSFRADLEELL